MKQIMLFVFLAALHRSLYCQQNDSIIEITETDITLNPAIAADNVSVFGIHLGMTKEEVNATLLTINNLVYFEDVYHMTKDYRIYVYDKDNQGHKNKCLLYLIWAESRKNLSRITFFEDFKVYLKGNSSKLLSLDAVDSSSALYKSYLGTPDNSEITLDIASIGLKHTTYYYYSKRIQIVFKEDNDKKSVGFAFFLPD